MIASSGKAGQNVRRLAFRRRWQSLRAFLAALGLPVIVVFMFPVLAIGLGFIAAIVIVAIAAFGTLGFIFRGIDLWQSANRADQGARAEENIADILDELAAEGWTFEYGLRLEDGLGDADVVCLSPHNKAYVIDVKSHRGTVIFQDHRLCRRMGRTIHAFKKDFLQIVMRQALQVREKKNLGFVTPLLVFTRAQMAVSHKKIRGVYVVGQSELIHKLKTLG